MTSKRRPYNQYSDEFKVEALKQLEASNRPATELAAQLGIRPNKDKQSELTNLRQENKRLKEDLDILKKSRGVLCQGTQVKHAYIQNNQHQYPIIRLCSLLEVSTSGYYDWKDRPISKQALDKKRLIN